MDLHLSRMGTTLIYMDTPPKVMAAKIATVVGEAMVEKGVSQREMSNRTGIALNTLNRRLNPATSKPFDVGELGLVLEQLDMSMIEAVVRAERMAIAA